MESWGEEPLLKVAKFKGGGGGSPRESDRQTFA